MENIIISRNFKLYRTQLGLSQAEMAGYLDLNSAESIEQIETAQSDF